MTDDYIPEATAKVEQDEDGTFRVTVEIDGDIGHSNVITGFPTEAEAQAFAAEEVPE